MADVDLSDRANQTADVAEISPVDGPVSAVVDLPGSKSYTNRALLIAALANGTSTIRRALYSDDTKYMSAALRQLGIAVEERESAAEFVIGSQGPTIPANHADLFIGNSGTSSRFLCAYLGLGHGHYRLDGVARMRERPIQPLLDGLRQLGVDARAERDNGCLPVIVHANGIRGGTIHMLGTLSSQYFSALLHVAPCTRDGITMTVEGDLVSKPYVAMTASVMREFGVDVSIDRYDRFYVRGGQSYQPRDYTVEPDASSASYFFAIAALTGGTVRVNHLSRSSAQSDLRVVDVFERMGAAIEWGDDHVIVRGPSRLRGVDVDMNEMSDVAQTVAAIAPFADQPVTIRGIEHNRHKETDRVTAVTTELRRLGARVDEHLDGWTIHPSTLHPATIHTYDDHRIAMSFAIVGLRVPGVNIANPSCVAKTFPTFFDVFRGATQG